MDTKNSTIEGLLARYEDNVTLRSLLQLIPGGFGGAMDIAATQTLNRIRQERVRAFFDELASASTPIDPDNLESEDFLHSYFATVKYALNTRRREKIQLFARLLSSSLGDSGPSSVDEYEEFLEMLDTLTYRELLALAIMDTYSDRPREPGDNDLQWTNTFWDEFVDDVVQQIGLPREEVSDFMNRISRTGCYEMYTGGFMDYEGGKGKLTPTYRRLKRFVSQEKL